MPSYISLLKEGCRILNPLLGQLSKPYVEAMLLDVVGVSREEFLCRLREECSDVLVHSFFEKIRRLESGEPLAYILGKTDFLGTEYFVSPGVLIPRPETEQLVCLVEDVFKRKQWSQGTVFELGYGSGVISLELAKRLPKSTFFGWDISEMAHQVGSENYRRSGVSNVTFYHEDFFSEKALWRSFNDRPVVIVSNPPYIQTKIIDSLDKSVRDYEPFEALCGGDDGLDYYRRFKQCLPHCDVMVFEIGYDLREDLVKVFQDVDWTLSFEKDFSGLDRFMVLIKDPF